MKILLQFKDTIWDNLIGTSSTVICLFSGSSTLNQRYNWSFNSPFVAGYENRLHVLSSVTMCNIFSPPERCAVIKPYSLKCALYTDCNKNNCLIICVAFVKLFLCGKLTSKCLLFALYIHDIRFNRVYRADISGFFIFSYNFLSKQN